MKTSRRGFTVLEVMIATAILLMAVVALGSAYLGVLKSYADVENEGDYKNDLKFAHSAFMAEAELETVEKGAEFETAAGHRVSWKATVEPTNIADLFAVTFECEINATELKEPLRVTEKFRMLRPTWSKPEDREKLRADARQRIQELQGANGGNVGGGLSGPSGNFPSVRPSAGGASPGRNAPNLGGNRR